MLKLGAGMRSGIKAGAALAGVVALAACGGSAPTNPLMAGQASCPRIAILADGADVTRFQGAGVRDLTAMVIDARIAGFDARCDYAGRDRRMLDVRVTPRFQAERGPAAQGRTADLGWFVALSNADDTEVLDRQAFTTRVTFGANAPRASVNGQTARLQVPIGDGAAAIDYLVRISFQLTPQELAQNRARGPR